MSNVSPYHGHRGITGPLRTSLDTSLQASQPLWNVGHGAAFFPLLLLGGGGGHRRVSVVFHWKEEEDDDVVFTPPTGSDRGV